MCFAVKEIYNQRKMNITLFFPFKMSPQLAALIVLCITALSSVFIPLINATHNSQCTASTAVYSSVITYSSSSYLQYYYYSCGSWWRRRRCTGSRTLYRRVSSSSLRVTYTTTYRCCSGYSGTYPSCSPICSPTCLHGTCSHPNTCTCNAGWTGSTCNTDICECCLNTDGCDQNCHNTDGSYTCSCNSGYTLNADGRACDDINECLTNNGGCGQQCTNTAGSHYCSCYNGYEFAAGSQTQCINIDECTRGISGCDHVCTDTVGSYTCSCNTGYQLQSDGHTCLDINECSTPYHGCEQVCHNTMGSYYCSCNIGYNLHANGKDCTDIDECGDDIHGCNHHCNNTIGSFYCTCMTGYHLSDDMRTCIDTNECLVNNGGCQHNCINEIGSFYCTCRDGYTLGDDQASCTADPCTTIFAPLNGYMSCNGPQVTDTICGFSCEPGYNLTGPSIRVCQPNHTWSYTTTTCPPLECPILTSTYNDDDHVFILSPCHNTYNFTCSILCDEGYYLNGTDNWEQTCDLYGSNDTVAWTKEPVCIESKPCDPSPCSVGTCSPGTDTLFKCDCRGTFRRGDQCEIGTVKVDPIPITAGGSFTLTYRTTPSESIIVVIKYSPNHFNGQNSIKIASPANTSSTSININQQSSGLFMIEHTLQGEDLEDLTYDKPEDCAVLITDPSTPSSNYFTQDNFNLLGSGCCWYKYNFQSPTPSCLSPVTFSSSCSWTDSTSFVGTDGIVFLWNEYNFQLPISIGGISHQLGANDFKFSMPGFSGQKQCDGICDICSTCTNNCTVPQSYLVNTADVEQMLKRRSLISTFFNTITPLFPSWLSIETKQAVQGAPFHLYDYTAFVGSAVDAAKLYGCEKLPFSPTNLIYNVRSSTDMIVIMTSNYMNVPSNYINYTHQDNSPICYSLDVCKGQASKLYVSVPESLGLFISSFQSFQDLILKGFAFHYEYLTFAEFGLTSDFTGQAIWNGSHYVYSPTNETAYDYEIKFSRIVGPLIGGNLNGSLDFSGFLRHKRVIIPSYQPPSLLEGKFNLIFTTRVGLDDVSLYLSSYNTKMIISGSNNSFISQGGVATQLYYKNVPYDSATFFANLFIIPDYTSQCAVFLYMQTTHMHEVDWVKFASNCLGLRVGRLEFLTEMNPVVTIYGTNNNIMTDYTISADSTLTANEKQCGRHVLLIKEDMPALQIKYSTTTSEVQGTLYSANVSVFDSVLYTDIDIRGSTCTFSGVTTIFDYYTISVSGSFSTLTEWDSTPFKLTCSLLDADFTAEINSYLYNYINTTASSAIEKRRNGERSIESARDLLLSTETTRNATLEEVRIATIDYNNALSQVTYWTNTVTQAQTTYDAALAQYVSDMNMLEQLRNCSLRTCPQVCVAGYNHTTCYTQTTTAEMGTCPVYEVVTRSYRQEFYYLARGWRYETRSYQCGRARRVGYSCQMEWDTCYRRECVSYSETRVRYVDTPYTVLELVNRPCVVEITDINQPGTCCQAYPCSYTVPDASCLAEKEGCSAQIEQIEGQGSVITTLYNAYLSAQQSLFSANIVLTQTTVTLQTAQQSLALIQPAYESAKFNLETSLANYEAIKEETEETFKLVTKLQTHGDPSQLLQVVNITFMQTIIAETPLVFPVQILYETPYSGQTYTLTYSMNFIAPQEIIKRSMSEDLVEHFIENSAGGKRRKRNTEEANSNTIYRQFQIRCSDLQNVQSYFGQLEAILRNVTENIDTIRSLVLEGLNNGSSGNTNRSINDLLQNTTSVFFEQYTNFSSNYNKSVMSILNLIDRNGFSNWKTNVEMLHNRTDSVGGHKCFGLTDCLDTALTLLETLLFDIPGDQAKDILQKLLNMKASITALGYQNHTLDEAMTKLDTALELGYATDNLGYWCSSPPVISTQPPLEVNISMGSVLMLKCGANSSLPVQYRWKKNGLFLGSQRSNILYMTSMQMINAGDYVCVATSAVGSTSALATTVNVYYSPILNLTLSDTQTLEGNDEGVNFGCDAHSWPPPGWTWYFRPDEQSEWQQIEGIDANVLPLIDPRVEQEGWYRCQASNWMGNISSTAYLTVLPVTIVRIMYPGQFVITKTNNTKASTGSGSDAGVSLSDVIDDTLTNYLNLKLTEIAEVSVETIDDTQSTVSFILTTPIMDMNSSDLVPLRVIDILADIAFPMITELETAKINLENAFGLNTSIQIQDSMAGGVDDDGSFEYETVSDSLQYFTRAFVCPEGYGLDIGIVFCVSCAPGTYQGPPAIVLTNVGSTARGNHYIEEEHPQCLACPVGSYQSDKGTTNCIGCPDYTTTASEGNNHVSDCIDVCQPATYSMTGVEPCLPCPDDYYQLNYGAVGCMACNGSTTIQQCIKPTDDDGRQDTGTTNTIIIIASSVAGGVLLVIVVMAIIVTIGCVYKRNKSQPRRKKEKAASFSPGADHQYEFDDVARLTPERGEGEGEDDTYAKVEDNVKGGVVRQYTADEIDIGIGLSEI